MIIFSYRKMRMDAELANMSWKIRWEDLMFKGIGKSLGASLKSLSNVSQIYQQITCNYIYILNAPRDQKDADIIVSIMKDDSECSDWKLD